MKGNIWSVGEINNKGWINKRKKGKMLEGEKEVKRKIDDEWMKGLKRKRFGPK